MEEAGAGCDSEPIPLGPIASDTGILTEQPLAFALLDCHVDPRKVRPDSSEYFDRNGLYLLTPEEVKNAIISGRITCGFTLATIAKAHIKGLLRL